MVELQSEKCWTKEILGKCSKYWAYFHTSTYPTLLTVTAKSGNEKVPMNPIL